MDLISIIVPVYNAEKYICKLLDSLLNQTCKNIEIILVDDGSTDNSNNLMKTYDDCRIKLIENNPGGVSSARNTGLKVAKGNYIMFVDSDDFIKENMVEHYYDAMKTYDVDLVCGNTDNTKNRQIKEDIILKGNNCGKRYIVDFYEKCPFNRPCCKMYKKSMILKPFDITLRKSEDLVFNVEYLSNVNSICIIPDYSYVVNSGNVESLSRKYRNNEFEMFCKSNRKLLDFLGDLGKYSNHEIRCRLFNAAKSSCLLCLKSKLSLKEKYHEVFSIVKNQELHDSLKLVDDLSLINRIVYFMFKYKLSLISFVFFYITILIKK